MIHRAVLIGVVALLALNALLFLVASWTLIRFPFELEYGEGIIMWQTDRVLHPSVAYHSIHQYPYIVFHYTPLYHVLVRLTSPFVHDSLVAGRTVVWLSALGVAFLVGLIVKNGTQPRPGHAMTAAMIASVLVFNVPNIDWVPMMRTDMSALFFAMAGLFLFLRYQTPGGRAAAAITFVAAIFTKQSMIAAPAAALGALLLARRYREAMWMAGGMAALGGAVAGLLAVATNGEFLRHTVSYNANPFEKRQLVRFVFQNLVGMNVLVGLALALPVTMLATKDLRDAAVNDKDGKLETAVVAGLSLGLRVRRHAHGGEGRCVDQLLSRVERRVLRPGRPFDRSGPWARQPLASPRNRHRDRSGSWCCRPRPSRRQRSTLGHRDRAGGIAQEKRGGFRSSPGDHSSDAGSRAL